MLVQREMLAVALLEQTFEVVVEIGAEQQTFAAEAWVLFAAEALVLFAAEQSIAVQ